MQDNPPTPIETIETGANEDSAENNSSRTNRSIFLWIAGLVIAFAIGMGSGYLIWTRPLQSQLTAAEQELAIVRAQAEASAAQEAQAAGANPDQQQEVRRYSVPADDDPVYGSQDAPITIIEFSDYECPYCRRWHQEVLPQIKSKYGDQIRLVYRDFPLYSIHPNAGPAAEAANCAGDQNRYWEFSENLFSGGLPLGRETYEAFAQNLELDMTSFQTCLDDRRYEQEVEADYNYASELGVRSTPTFFINGLAVVGAQPFEVFEQIIDMELAGEIP